jgi:hypothetical protein
MYACLCCVCAGVWVGGGGVACWDLLPGGGNHWCWWFGAGGLVGLVWLECNGMEHLYYLYSVAFGCPAVSARWSLFVVQQCGWVKVFVLCRVLCCVRRGMHCTGRARVVGGWLGGFLQQGFCQAEPPLLWLAAVTAALMLNRV